MDTLGYRRTSLLVFKILFSSLGLISWFLVPFLGVSLPTVIILVWDLIVGSLVEISDARRLFPHFWFSAGGRKVIPEVPCLVFVSWL